MTGAEELAAARALRIALGYESREVRIGELKQSRYLDVRKLMQRLEAHGVVEPHSIKEVLMLTELDASFTRNRS